VDTLRALALDSVAEVASFTRPLIKRKRVIRINDAPSIEVQTHKELVEAPLFQVCVTVCFTPNQRLALTA
jgi:hypothetical protein